MVLLFDVIIFLILSRVMSFPSIIYFSEVTILVKPLLSNILVFPSYSAYSVSIMLFLISVAKIFFFNINKLAPLLYSA